MSDIARRILDTPGGVITILISGRRASGKSTLAQVIRTAVMQHGLSCEVFEAEETTPKERKAIIRDLQPAVIIATTRQPVDIPR
jgi:adenylylsulfate kinase-like enzyme